MTTEQPCSDLLDVAAVAELLGVGHNSARTIINRSAKTNHKFPEPCIRLGGNPGWLECDVITWINARPGTGKGPRPGRKQTDEQRLRSLMGDRDYLTPRQCAKWLGVTVEQLSRMRGNAPRPTKAGGYLRFFESDIRTWLAERDERKAG